MPAPAVQVSGGSPAGTPVHRFTWRRGVGGGGRGDVSAKGEACEIMINIMANCTFGVCVCVCVCVCTCTLNTDPYTLE